MTHVSVCFTNDNTGYIVAGYDSIIKTQDAGLTWKNIYYPHGRFLTSIKFIDSNTGFAIGEQGALIKTTNGGSSWNILSSCTGNELGSIDFTSPDTGYLVGSCGAILKTTNGGGFPMGVPDLISNTSPIKIFPNPATTEIVVEAVHSLLPGYFIIYNLQGQQLISRPVTESKTQLNISSLPSGVYFVRLSNDRTVEVGKIIKE